MTTTTYSTNNSGGSWWLRDEDWKALEAAGWDVQWYKPGDKYTDKSGRYMGALATKASRTGIGFREAIAEWESATGESANDLGCSCCGTPHWFYSDEGDDYSPDYPTQGARY